MNFNPEYSILYIVISFFIAFSLSFFYYRKTNIPPRSKFILTGLRVLSIFTFLILLFISYFTFIKDVKEKPLNIFLLDASESLTLENRKNELLKTCELIKKINNDFSENKYYLFAGDIAKEIELNEIANLSIDEFKHEYTNLAKTLNTLIKTFGEKKISSINILSDGIINEGGNPVYSYPQINTIFNYILIGDTIQKNDLAIKNIFFNPNAYIESNTQILVEFNSYGFNKEVKVKLFEDDNLVQEKKVNTNNEKAEYSYSFFVKSNNKGIKKYKIEIVTEQGEITEKNNSEEFFIDFFDNKFKLLVLSGNPNPDFSYLKESINEINNFEAKFLTLKSPAEFYEGQIPFLNEFDLLIIINFPNTSTDLNLVNNLNEKLKSVNLPVFFIAGSNTDYEKLKLLSDYTPFSSLNKTENEEKSTLKLIEDLPLEISSIFGITRKINNLPEIFIPGINFTLFPETRTVLYSGKVTKPVLIISKNNDRSSAALVAYNFFKWRLNKAGNESRNLLGNILTGVSTGICDKEKNKKVHINQEKQVYSTNEIIKINGFINKSETVENSSVLLQVYNNSFTKNIDVIKSSSNSFIGEIKNLPEGEYFIQSTLIQNGAESGNDIKKILVKKTNIEFKKTKADNSILNILSSKTKGDRISGKNLDEIYKKIELQNKEDINYQKQINKMFLNSSLVLLLFLILLMSIEWFIRKRLNLP